MSYEINIAHLYPDLLNLYGDRGNIICLKNRCNWRNISVNIIEYNLKDEIDFESIDILFLGGGSDKEQFLVTKKLVDIKNDFISYAQNDGVILAICGGYQLLGHYYKIGDETINGLSLLDIYTESKKGRLIGNVVIESTLDEKTTNVVGFENHGGRTIINSHNPLGKVLYGFGNNGEDFTEGVLYKNVIGTYLHGPLLPKNPNLADYIIKKALQKKYNENIVLDKLNDDIEIKAQNYIINKYLTTKNA